MRHLILGLTIVAAAWLAATCGGGGSGEECSADAGGPDVCGAGFLCMGGECQARCSCGVEEECTATAPECQFEIVSDTGSEVQVCIPCSFTSQCDDENACTKDSCEADGCCAVRVYKPEEALGCCSNLGECVDKLNPLSTIENPDGDPCTLDKCEDHHCTHEVDDPLCCRSDQECTDENDCTKDTCVENHCVFSAPVPNCCSKDGDCKDDNPCTMDICVQGLCAHPQDSLNAECKCGANTDCDDSNPCTLDACLDGKCIYDKANAPVCCGDSSQCNDQDPTTTDFCKMYTCIHQKQKTCTNDGMCSDDNHCTDDRCESGKCLHEHTDDPYCCNHDQDCDDENPCTVGACVDWVCKHTILSDPGCCKASLECDDGIGCTIDECVKWMCVHTPVGAKCCTPETADQVCNDGNPCTIDSCKNGLCDWQMVTTGCCTVADDCMDCISTSTGASCQVDHTVSPPKCIGENCVDNVCTVHSCSEKFCVYAPVVDCCLTNDDCEDGNCCTKDICTADHKCKNEMEIGCCANNGMCNDGKICTADTCDIVPGDCKGTCKHTPKPDCCNTPDDCDDKTCKDKFCQNGNCIYLPQDNCCVHDEECDDGKDCTIDKCTDSNKCEHTPTGICS